MTKPRKEDVRPIFNRVQVLRIERGLTRKLLAEQVSVNPYTIGALERGDHLPSLDLAMKVCDAFALPVEAVFSRTEFPAMSEEPYGRRAVQID
ncbi:helix-turn-helix transcriptional regulator [Arthrobacter sp. H35-D1]|uniref:helix-turn-helix transcriptional regulator n=1 Tax=Arthrobacter sp. H35-D1 TaxID=3046202 RepID=UPI0024BB9897|nr:helix-turn-helix transcriptional regulator [Arthrobacter sp. H35-D1]MDJ0314288.1 helix-turn-helix transcriptional regulator [Arthrobacter sp. H35-D1]